MKGWSAAAGIFLILLVLLGVWNWQGYPWIPGSRSPDPFAGRADPSTPLQRFHSRVSTTPNWVRELRVKQNQRVSQRERRKHEKACFAELSQFKFEDRYFGCDDALNGRWYLHFKPDGSISIAGPPTRSRKYHPDNESIPSVNLDEIFKPTTTYEETSARIVFHNEGESLVFLLIPDITATDPKHCLSKIHFWQEDRPTMHFTLTQSTEWQSNFEQWQKEKL